MYGDDSEDDDWPTTRLKHGGHTALLQYLTVERVILKLSGDSSLNNCIVNFSRIYLSCSRQTQNIRNSLTLYESQKIDSAIEGIRECKDLKLNIIRCTINRYRVRKLYHAQGTIVFDVGPAAHISVEIADSFVDCELWLSGAHDNNNINLNIHRSHMQNSDPSHSTMRVHLSSKVRNNNVQVQISDSKISNSKDYGLWFEVDMTFSNTIEIRLSNTSVSNQGNAGGICVRNYQVIPINGGVKRPSIRETVINIAINNCTFINNKLAVVIEIETYINIKLEMLISDSKFYGNENAIDFRRRTFETLASPNTNTRHFFVSLKSVTLENNSPYLFKSGVVRLIDVDMLTLRDCRIINNRGTAIESYFSGVTLAGEMLFSNNTSIRGGALLLYESYFYLASFSSTSFINNYAQEVGGAIYVKQRPYFQFNVIDYPPCFYQIKGTPELNLNFKNNFASGGGDDIYGGSLYSPCRFFDSHTSRKYELFRFRDKTVSSVTSDPARVCLCDDLGTPQCASIEYIYRELPPRYPGEVFTIPAVVVGYDFGTVPGIVHSKLLWESPNTTTLKRYLQVQEIRDHRQCALLNFTIQSQLTNTTYEIQLFVQENTEETDKSSVQYSIKEFTEENDLSDTLLLQHIYISLTLQDCPTGFTLTTIPPYICTCHPTLEENAITVCIITNHTGCVYRSGTVWVSDSFTGNETNSFVVHQYCPYDYCKTENISVNLQFPDTQCAFNHSGVLCGGCHGNLSLTLGTSKCLPCDNRYVSLLVVFTFAGFALVFFIKVIDLTVAKGTLNGLIFYANIVWANRSILFPTTETFHPVQQILYTFIAWLNLDLGIETCFIEGLDAYWKTWLQFVFPLYVWTITGAVIIASHYSTKVSKIFGNNSVPVLATLILLSYAKLLRTIITTLGFSLLNYSEGTRVVWSFDGNVLYFGAAHTILFLVALAALLLLWLPYTTVLLTLQWMRRKSYLKPLRWINRWKPFFDAYFGQLKPKHHYWVGLLLLARVVLLVLFAATSAIVPKLNIIAMAIIGLLLFIKQTYTGSMYKTLHLSILENSFIVNLTVLGMAKLYMLPSDPVNTPVTYTSIGVVFIEFLAIVIYHTWNRLKSTYLTFKRRHRGEDAPTDRELRVVAAVPRNHMHYREPLLDSSVQDK